VVAVVSVMGFLVPGAGRVLGSGPCRGLCQRLDRAAALAVPGRPILRY